MNKQIVFYMVSFISFLGVDCFASAELSQRRVCFKPTAVSPHSSVEHAVMACGREVSPLSYEQKIVNSASGCNKYGISPEGRSPVSDHEAKPSIPREIDSEDVASLVTLYGRALELEAAVVALEKACQRSDLEKKRQMVTDPKMQRLREEEQRLRVLRLGCSPKVAMTVTPKIRAKETQQQAVAQDYDFDYGEGLPSVAEHCQNRKDMLQKKQAEINEIEKDYAGILPLLYKKCQEHCMHRAQAAEKDAAIKSIRGSSGRVRNVSAGVQQEFMYAAERMKERAEFFANMIA